MKMRSSFDESIGTRHGALSDSKFTEAVVHIDDLNFVSFYDYLRETVVASERQIIFATVNEKLQILVERKFDFLEIETSVGST